MQAICVPFVGVLGNMVNRMVLIVLGALVWAAMSLAFGLSTSYTEVRTPATFEAPDIMCIPSRGLSPR